MVERRRLQGPKRPFVRIGDERDARMLDHVGGRIEAVVPLGLLDLPAIDQEFLLHRRGKDPLVPNSLVIGTSALVDGAKDPAVALINMS